ncbi:MAG: phenylalanine--tRNA ligase subunit beta [bacterium]
MKISLNWIKDYIDIPKNITPEKLAELLTLHSVEVEGIEEKGEYLDGVVVGEILEIKKHPDADKLNIAKVDVGEDGPRQIVFGDIAKMQVGFKVPVALAPTTLPGGVKINKAKLRGEISEGMFCIDQELGLKKGGIDIHFFDKSVKNGTPIVKVLNLDDLILEVDNKTITHRPDLWGHRGMAREIAAIVKAKFQVPNLKFQIPSSKPKNNLRVEIRNYDLCRRYIGVAVDNIKIGSSPEWMKNRLNSVGVRSINNIVDITNYIMLDTGQPLHAFDYDKLFSKSEKDGVKIIVRNAIAGEKITTLDGVERKLDEKMLIIADEKTPIALAGVMGGEISEVDENTKKIVIEIANFEPINIRQTSAKIGLRTESVMRYEKSLDPNLPEVALAKVLNLIKEIIPKAAQASKVVDQKKFKLNNVPIKLSLNYVHAKIGVKISSSEVVRILKSLGFEIAPLTRGVGGLKNTKQADTIFNVKAPSWRATKDVSIADDLVEEIARIYGFDNIVATAPLVRMQAPKINEERQFERYLKNILNGLGFDEVYNYALVGEKLIKQAGKNPDEHIKLINSLSIDLEFLRQSLFENLLVNIKNNLRYFDAFKIFEAGLVFNKSVGKYLAHPDKNDMLPEQKKMIAGVVVDTGKKAEEIFSQTKEAAENLLAKSVITAYQILPDKKSKNTAAEIIIKNEKIGQVILIDKNIQNNFDINPKFSCGYFDIDLDKLFSLFKPDFKYKPLSKFPEIKIDLAVVASKEILWHDIEAEIKKFAGAQLKKIELFDVYQGKNIAVGKKSFAMHLSFGEEMRTMEMGEVEKLRDKIVGGLREKLGIDIRS